MMAPNRGRSSGPATLILTWNLSGPTSTVATGFFRRLENHDGALSAPLLEAMTARSSPYGR